MATAKWVDISVPTARIYEVSDIIRGLETHSLVVADTGATEEGDNVRGFDAHSLARADTGTSEEGANANGMESHVLVKADAGTSEEGENASGLESHSPVKADTGQAAHLKPDHRWQMPLPRNLLSDPESFDPASTAWATTTGATYAGAVANVGPNGETAAQIDFDGTADAGLVQSLSLSSHSPFTQGFYVRAVSGTQDVMPSHTDGGAVDGSIVTVSTDWQWVDPTITPSGTLDQIGLRSDVAGSIYVLRAGLNRGSSLAYSTRSAVPQEIPDVIAGADLQNGSSSGADTNDLDFGVDGETVPYAVADGDDETSTLPQDGTETWAVRVYIPASVGADVQYLGDSALGYPTLVYDDANGDLRIRYKDSGGATQQGPSVTASEGSWHTVAVTVDGSDLRLNVDGTTDEQTDTDLSITTDPRLLGTAAGARVQHPERHPVLTPAEAEAVRQRLANNPSDPVPKTEAWDLTSETSPHNLVTRSEEFDNADWSKVSTSITADATNDPDGNATADALIENSGTDSHGVFQSESMQQGEEYVLSCYAKPNGRDWFILAFQGQAWDTAATFFGPGAWFDVTNGALGSQDGDLESYGMTSVGNGWYRCWIRGIADADGNTNLSIEIADADQSREYTGDGSSGLYIWGAQLTCGSETPPPYVKTFGSIAYPQTVPALRQSSNDLTLGSSSGADTNDGQWIAPLGMGEGGDDQLRAPTKRPTVTWVGRVKYTATRAFGRSANGWKVTATDLVVEDTGGTTASAAHGRTINDGAYHTITVLIDEVAETAEVYIDGGVTPDATVDLSTVGTLKSSDVELLPEGGVVKQPAYYTRPLTGEETTYLHERLVDNPESAFPTYALP